MIALTLRKTAAALLSVLAAVALVWLFALVTLWLLPAIYVPPKALVVIDPLLWFGCPALAIWAVEWIYVKLGAH